MKFKGFLLFLMIFLAAFCKQTYAQDILAKGVLIDQYNKNRIALADIINLRTRYTVGSNDLGFFKIQSKVGDTLLILKRNYMEAKRVVISEKDLVIYMNADYNSIDEVVINGDTKQQKIKDLQSGLKNSGDVYNGRPPILSYLFNPVSALYSIFSPTGKNARRFRNYYNNEIKQINIDPFFNEEIVKTNTPLQGAELRDFMVKYRPDYNKVVNWNTYDAINYIKASYKSYTDTLGKGIK